MDAAASRMAHDGDGEEAGSADPIEYVHGTEPGLAERAARTCEVELHPPGRVEEIIVTGPCPACGDTTSHVEPLFLYRGATARGRDVVVEVICACGVAHPGAPQGEDGCGRSWVLSVLVPG